MPDFDDHHFDITASRAQLNEFRQLLETHAELSERKDILPFLRARPHLLALFGFFNASQSRYDRIAWEYPLFGAFHCDFAVGDSITKAYTFIECEDARRQSVFVQLRGRLSTDWSFRFEHGYSQVIDWFYKIATLTDSADMESRLGKRSITYSGILVAGRDQFLSPGERLRLEWRREHVVVNSKKVVCLTYDQLCKELHVRLECMTLATQAGLP